ncbi:MAG: hypothetical protein ACHP6H_06845, partial [Legionellales bacterium]
MLYFVTFCTSDQDAGSNPFWHSCILLSQMDDEGQLMEVIDTWEFNGLPSTSESKHWAKQFFVKMTNLDLDLIGNHGMLCHAEYRYLDRGRGLHAVTFEVTEAQLRAMQNRCINRVEEQNRAIQEAADFLKITPKPKDKFKVYEYEHQSNFIFAVEQFKAAQEGRESRLKPFQLPLTLGLSGPQASTCKSQAVSIFDGILSAEQIARITMKGTVSSTLETFPRLSGKTEYIYLHTRGPLSKHTKASGEVVYFRDNKKDSNVKLYWTLPPQEFEALSETTSKLFKIDPDYVSKFKSSVKKLQGLKWLFINAKLPERLQDHKNNLVAEIEAIYQDLFSVGPRYTVEKNKDWYGYLHALFSLPAHSEQRVLQNIIDEHTQFFNRLYLAAVDGWEIEE